MSFRDGIRPNGFVLASAEVRREQSAKAIAEAILALRPGDRLEVEVHDGSSGDGRIFTVTVATPAES